MNGVAFVLLRSCDYLNIRHWVNLPSSSSPVVCTARICVLCRVCVLRIECHPTANFAPVVTNLLSQSFRRPIGSCLSHDCWQSWRTLHYHALRRSRVCRAHDQFTRTISVRHVQLATL